MSALYRDNLGIGSTDGTTDFIWREHDHPDAVGRTQFDQSSRRTQITLARPGFMINYRVAILEHMLEQLRRSGVTVEKVEDYNYGRFAWITDPEGNRIELWEPKRQ